MKARTVAVAAAAVAASAVCGAAVWLLRDRPDPVAASSPAEAPPSAPSDAPPPPAPAVSDAEARLLAELEEERGTWRTLRDAFESAPARSSPGSEARMTAALRGASAEITWSARCKPSLCRVTADAPPALWHALLRGAPSLRAVAERVAVDPDASSEVAYVALAPAAATRGHDLLRDVETEFLTSSDARYCLSSVGATGTIDYDLRVDSSGYTFRISTDLPRTVAECVTDVLSDILRLSPVPPEGSTFASRTFGIRR